MDLTITDDLWQRIKQCAAASQSIPLSDDADALTYATGLLEAGVEQAEDDLVDLGDEG